MQHTNGVAVLAAHPAHIDRRALSQAWYSALHLVERAPRTRAAHGATRAQTPAAPKAPPGAPAASAQRADDLVRACKPLRAAAQRRDASALAGERRERTCALARRIAHVPGRRAPRGIPSSLAVSAANGRVHLLVRGDGARVRVVAVCAPGLRERVERALGHARCALAQRGFRAEAA